jgi:inhibitor of KinA sporulation pathway (predicted exonuclease)
MDAGTALLNVIDVEATCWEDGPPPGQVSEIIEIGLAVVDLAAGQRVARHHILVRPERSAVSAFCTRLTGLTQADVDAGVSFAAACQLLIADHQSLSRPWASWGDYDRNQFARQCQAAGTEFPFGACHINAKAAFARAHGLRTRPGMAAALRIAGLALEGRHHRGEDDAWNIAALIIGLNTAGHWPPQPVPGRTKNTA